MVQKAALGKGIASLIQTSSTFLGQDQVGSESPALINNQPLMISVNKIKPNQYQPRKIFKEKDIIELAESIKENGIVQPLIVFENGKDFELVAGERRLRAAKMAGIEFVPVVVKKVTDREKLVHAIIENVQRSELNCVEEALAYFQLMEEFKLTQEEVAKKIGKDRSTIANFLRILKLPREVIGFLQREQIDFGHAKVLASIKEPELIKRLAQEIVEKKLSVRDLEVLIGKKSFLNKPTKTTNTFADKFNPLREKLETKTGFHINLKGKKNGSGEISIKFNNEAEFNDIFHYFMTK